MVSVDDKLWSFCIYYVLSVRGRRLTRKGRQELDLQAQRILSGQ